MSTTQEKSLTAASIFMSKIVFSTTAEVLVRKASGQKRREKRSYVIYDMQG